MLIISIVFLILELRWNRRESHRIQREDAFQAAMDLELTLFASDTWHQTWEKWVVAVGDYENGVSIDDLKVGLAIAKWESCRRDFSIISIP